jgi:hypothetical protein
MGPDLQRFASSIQGQIEGLARSVQELKLERGRLRLSLEGLPSGTQQPEEQQQQQRQPEQLEPAAGTPLDWLSLASRGGGRPGQPSRALLQQLHSSGLPQQLPGDVLEALQRAALAFRAPSPKRGAQQRWRRSRQPCPCLLPAPARAGFLFCALICLL